jgi:4-hydroxybenzoate polyprenyltransferase
MSIFLYFWRNEVSLKKTVTSQGNQQETSKSKYHPSSFPIAPMLSQSPSFLARLWALFMALRPRQWTKNLAVFVGLVFSQRLFDLLAFERTALAFAAFCLASSSVYLLNDLLDLEKDREHPVKRTRPLASGRLPISWAIITMGLLILLCAALTILLFRLPVAESDFAATFGGASILFACTIFTYLLLMTLYSVYLKHVVLIDVFIIASGFVLRTLAGTVVIPVITSPWLLMVACLLSLFLALSKRRHELVLLEGRASSHRRILQEYSIPMLDQMITIVVTATIMAYSLYTVQSSTGNHRLIFTVPLVLYGIFRYLYLIYMRKEGGSPEEVLLRDRHMLATVLICIILIITVLYLLPK